MHLDVGAGGVAATDDRVERHVGLGSHRVDGKHQETRVAVVVGLDAQAVRHQLERAGDLVERGPIDRGLGNRVGERAGRDRETLHSVAPHLGVMTFSPRST